MDSSSVFEAIERTTEFEVLKTSGHYNLFAIDAFLSHNREDISHELADALRSRGVRVWHDTLDRMADGSAKQAVALILKESRYVVLCLRPDFRDSSWCRAEYEPALEIQNRTGIERVLVVRMDPEMEIPPHLSSVRSFSSSEEDLDRLAAILRECPAHGSREERYRARFARLRSVIVQRIQALQKEAERDGDLWVACANRVFAPGGRGPDAMALMTLREYLYAIDPLPEVNDCGIQLIRSLSAAAYFLADSSDDRANALYLAVWAALLDRSSSSQRIACLLVRTERNRALIEHAHFQASVLARRAQSRPRPFRDVVVAVLERRERALSDCARLRSALNRGKVLGTLEIEEEMRLWALQVRASCTTEIERPIIHPRTVPERLRPIHAALGISYLETRLRFAADLLVVRATQDSYTTSLVETEAVFAVFRDAIGHLAETSSRTGGKPMILAEDYYVDSLLRVFAFFRTSRNEEIREVARSLAHRCHAILCEFGDPKFSHEYEIFDCYIDDIAAGDDLEAKRHKLTLALRGLKKFRPSLATGRVND